MRFHRWVSKESVRARRDWQRVGQSAKRRLLFCEPLESRALLAANFAQFVDPNPSPGNQFGTIVAPLSTGNVVVTSPQDDYGGTDAGAVYLFNGATGALISTLRGSHDGDNIANGGITVLTNGNFVIRSPFWDSDGAADVGAATWGSGTTGVKGVVNTANSLVGSTAGDRVGLNGVRALTNGNYLVSSATWDNGAVIDAGAVTFGSGMSGIKGFVSIANSLVGSTANDQVGAFVVVELTKGNYVVISPVWDNGAVTEAGAVTFGSGTAGVKGAISAANSLVGSTANDQVGSQGMALLTNGNYVVVSTVWDNGAATDAGAATWGSGTAGIKGAISAANSLIGSTANDKVGSFGVADLTNGNYVVISPRWDNGTATDAGAATWGSGTAGVKGVISAANSLVGSTTDDQVGEGSVALLTNGNYVVSSPHWDNGVAANVGAVTWGSGTVGVKGIVSAANSLVGSTATNLVGFAGVRALTNGNYVVKSPLWDNGAATDVGAATWGSGAVGVKGVVSAANSLVGSTTGDSVGDVVVALTNGNYVVSSTVWNDGATADVGAATWGSGTAGIQGVVSAANSLVGSTANDQVGGGVIALTNGNYVVTSPFWDDGAEANVGAATWGNGTAGVQGVVSFANSLIGSTANNEVGSFGVGALTNGNYVVRSPDWDNGTAANAGAATWGSGTAGVHGVVSALNSLVGSTANDQISSGGIAALTNGNYVVLSPVWNNGAGAATWGSGTTGISGSINSQSSALGAAANAGLQSIVVDNVNDTFFVRFLLEGGGTVRVGSQINGFQPAPVIGSFGAAVSFTENGGSILISSTATVSDVDSPNFFKGELRINFKSGGTADDRLRIRTEGTGSGQINVQGSQVRFGTIVLGTFSGGVGTTPLVVKLTNQATASRVQQLLRNITFFNVSDTPATAPRTVRMTLSDGDANGGTSAPVFKKISVIAVNDAPQLSLGGTIGYVHDSAAITLAAGALVSDVDSSNFSGGRLRVRITDGTSNSNRLSIGSGFTVDSSGNVLQGATIIGKRVSNGFGANELIITFNTNATPAVVQQLVRAITFKTVGGAAGQRKVVFTVSDGDGGVSEEKIKTVNVS